jgi:tetratricopeptide (TPR) repeat protein
MRRLLMILAFAVPAFAQTTRIASDFEIAQMQQQLARSHDFLSQLSGHLNLGDARLTRGESTLARREYAQAYELASNERLEARRASDLARYATATSYAALAEAKLGKDANAFELSEEAIRYEAGEAKTWNLFASTMSLLRKPAKAASASRNAVALARRDFAQSPDVSNRIDLAIYQYALASALIDMVQTGEAERLLVEVTSSLRSPAFDDLRAQIARMEAFENYSSARGEAASHISLLNRSQLRLASLYESRGDAAQARQQYENVLAARSDDPTALAAIARLSQSGEHFADAFDANPFSMALVRDYQHYLTTHRSEQADGDSAGARMRRVLIAMNRGELQRAKATLDQLDRQYPDNDTLRTIRAELDKPTQVPAFLRADVTAALPTASDLRSLIALFNDNRFTPEQRGVLDKIALTSLVQFDERKDAPANQTAFESGEIEGVHFRFSEPMAFNGDFEAHAPLRLTYRIFGASNDELLFDPIQLEAAR